MNKFLIILFFITGSAFAEIVTVTGEHQHLRDISIKEGCDWAKKDALSKAKEKVLGLKIFSEENEMCNAVDGKSNCVRNQLFLSETLGHITAVDVIKSEESEEKFDNSENKIYVCRITIKANVEKRSNTLDASYDFGIALNNLAFREEEELEIDINLTKPVFLNIFQWLPYENKDDQIYKIFPNEIEKNNYIEKNKFELPIIDKNTLKRKAKYLIEFPKNVNNERVDEYLIFIFSKGKIDFFDNYLIREDLIKKFMGEKEVKLLYKGYTIIK